MMDNMESSTGGEFSSDRLVIGKRKRSKRQHPSPPSCAAAFRVAALNSSHSGGGGGGRSGGSNCFSNNDQLSPSISVDWTTEVEEEMVDCLMLLANGICPMDELRKDSHRSTDSGVAGKDDEYVVYECKTCYRTFPSFQALGGHSASHKRPKLAENTERSLVLLPPLINTDEEEEEVREARIDTKFNMSPLPLQMIPAGKGKAKVHECSICGAGFMSGQALGGHMRRHRTTVIKPALNPSSSSPPRAQIITNVDPTEQLVENRSSMLMFDLNVPAPEDEHRSSNSEYNTVSQGINFLPIFE